MTIKKRQHAKPSSFAKITLTSSTAAVALMLAAPQVIAQSITSMTDGEMITLDGTNIAIAAPVITIANNNVEVTNNGTLTTTGGSQTVQVNADTTDTMLTNTASGIIEGDSRAVNIQGDNFTLENNGIIRGTGDQRNGTVYANLTAQGFVINNNDGALIDAGLGNDGAGIALEIGNMGNPVGGSITNTGIINGRGQGLATGGTAGDGIRFFGPGFLPAYVFNGDITNSGTITSESTQGTVAGLRFANRIGFQGTLTNESGGVISSAQNGVYFGDADHTGGTVVNAGTISSNSRAFNIDGTGLTLTNGGDILGTGVQRNGTLYADATATDYTINNFGTIDAVIEGSGFAAEIDLDGNTFELVNLGVIQGRGDVDNADGFRVGNPGNIGTATVDITNSGTINSESNQGTTAGLRFVNGISFAGTIDNSGTISGVRNGVYFGNPVMGQGADHSNGVFTNTATGVISSDSRAFNIDGIGLTLNNAGSILGTGNQRNGTLYSDGTATDYTVNNSGTIDAGAGNEGSAFAAEVGPNGTSFTFDNSGTLQGRGQGSAATGAAGDGFRIGNVGNSGLATAAITNSGTIASESAIGTTAGLRIVNGISLSGTIDNFGTITGTQNGLYFGNATDAGGGDFTNAVVNNSGIISSGSRALNIDGLGLTINNTGSILGLGNQRNGTVYADATANSYTLNNAAAGVIDAGAGNSGSGVSLQSGNVDGETVSFTINNAGTIQGRGTDQVPAGLRIFAGAANVNVDAAITNSGTIASETGAAILIDNVDFTGTIQNSGILTGTSVLDASTAQGAVNFNQIGGGFQSDFIGSNFTDILNISGPSFALGADILNNVTTTIASGTIASVNGTRNLQGDFTLNGTLNLSLGQDLLAVDGSTVLGSSSVVNIDSGDINNLTLGQEVFVITETGTFTDNGVQVNVTDNDFLVDYRVNLAGAVSVIADAVDLGAQTNDPNFSVFGSAITAAFTAGQLSQANANALNNLPTGTSFDTVAGDLLPTLNEGVSREVWETNSLANNFIADRLQAGTQIGAWAQAQFRTADRDDENVSVTGYDADATSFSLGFDTQVSNELRLGVAGSFSNIEIENDVATERETELDTFQIAAYSQYDIGKTFFTGQIGYIFGDAETERTSALGDVNGEFDVSGFTARGLIGYKAGSGSFDFTPHAGFRYGSISEESFTETGGLGLIVNADTTDFFEGVIGARFAPRVETNGWAIRPSLRADYIYDFTGDSRDQSITLPGAVPFVLTSGDALESRFEIGADLDIVSASGASFGIGYEGDFASGYTASAGYLRLRIGF